MSHAGRVTGSTPFGRRVGDATMAGLRAIGRRLDFDEDEVLFRQGEHVDDVLVVESGLVRVFVRDQGEVELTLGLYGRGELLNEMSALELGPRAAGGVGHRAGSVTQVTGPRFRAFLKLHPEVREHAFDVVLHRLRRHDQERAAYQAELDNDVVQRVGRTILILAQHFGAVRQDGAVQIPRVSRHELALAAAAPETKINEVLRGLHAIGLLTVGRRRLVVPSTSRLRLWLEDRSAALTSNRLP